MPILLYALTASTVSSKSFAHIYLNANNYSPIESIYDDGAISVFTAYDGYDKITIYYDLSLNQIIYTVDGGFTNIYKENSVYYMLSDNGNEIVKLSI